MHVGEFVEGEHGTEAERERKVFFLFLFSVSSPPPFSGRVLHVNPLIARRRERQLLLPSSTLLTASPLSLRLLSPPPAAVRILLVRRNERDRGRRAQLQLLGTGTETCMMV